MKPTRVKMCHSLVMNYGLYKKMEIFVRFLPYQLMLSLYLYTFIYREPNLLLVKRWLNSIQMNTLIFWIEFHLIIWTHLLKSKLSVRVCLLQLNLYLLNNDILVNVGDDCPVFDGLFEYCSISAGGSMGNTNYLHN